MQTANKVNNDHAVVRTLDGFVHAEPLYVQKRIGSTVYGVEVYVKNSTGETIEEKILRLIRNDLHPAPSHVNLNVPQTGRLSERSSA